MTKDEALKKALEALQWNWGGEPLPTLELQAINAIKEALAQSDQESDDLTIAYMSGFHDGKNTPQRTWVGLTEGEIDRLNFIQVEGCQCSLSYIDGIEEFAKDIEAKLREKNGC